MIRRGKKVEEINMKVSFLSLNISHIEKSFSLCARAHSVVLGENQLHIKEVGKKLDELISA